jgi:hypothetical protein
MVPSFFLDGWFNPFTMAEIGGIVAIAALVVALAALFAVRRISGICRRCRFDLRGAQHETCPECGAALDSEKSRTTAVWAPRSRMLAANLTLAGVAGLLVFFPGPIVRTLKGGAASALSDRALLERTLGADGNEALPYHDARTSEIAKGTRKPDGSIASFTELCDAIDRATIEASSDRLASRLLPADRAGFFALKSSHHLVADRDALARQIATALFAPTRLSSPAAEGRRMQAMGACMQTDASVRLALLADLDFVSRSKELHRIEDSREFAIYEANPLVLAGVNHQLRIYARVRSVALRATDGTSQPIPFHEATDSHDWVPVIEIEPPDGAPAGTLVFTVELEAYAGFARTVADSGQLISKCARVFEIAYDPAKPADPSGG